jgi:hypothetical protein
MISVLNSHVISYSKLARLPRTDKAGKRIWTVQNKLLTSVDPTFSCQFALPEGVEHVFEEGSFWSVEAVEKSGVWLQQIARPDIKEGIKPEYLLPRMDKQPILLTQDNLSSNPHGALSNVFRLLNETIRNTLRSKSFGYFDIPLFLKLHLVFGAERALLSAEEFEPMISFSGFVGNFILPIQTRVLKF